MCDLEIRVLGHVQPYTVMCALPVNLFNEIVFIFVWFWIVIMGLCTIGSITYWLMVSVILPHQTRFIKTRLIAMGRLGAAPHHMVRSFVENYLRNDGILIIQLVSENASDLIAAELICALWDQYRDKAEMGKKNEMMTRGSLAPVGGYETDTDDDDDDYHRLPRKYFEGYKPNPGDSESESDYERNRSEDNDDYDGDDSEGEVRRKGYRPPIPPKPKREDMEVTRRGPVKDPEKLRKEKILKDKRQRELKEMRRGDRKHLRSGYR